MDEKLSEEVHKWTAIKYPDPVAGLNYVDTGRYTIGVGEYTTEELKADKSRYDANRVNPRGLDEYYESVKKMAGSFAIPLQKLNKSNDKIPKSIKPRRGLTMDQKLRNAEVRYNLKDEYALQECLDAFDNLCKKEIGDIYLTGSVALYLQGKITRTIFKDLDVVVVGEYMLDDDIYDNPYGCKYPPDPSGIERTPVAFNDVKIDIFSNINYVNSVNVEYLGKTYLCQDYKDIIKAKLRMVLPKMKDLDELLETSFEITYK